MLAKGQRRQFTAAYKLKSLEEVDRCTAPGATSALLRREGLYSSHLSEWRKARRSGASGALKKARGPQGKRRDPVAKENEDLRRANARLRRELAQALTILEIQEEASEILGIPLKDSETDDSA